MLEKLTNGNLVSEIILSLAMILFSGFLVTRITKKCKLPNVTGYLLAGILIGPFALKLIPQTIITQMDFITDIALSYIAFGVGKYFKLSALKKNGRRIVLITVMESLFAAVLVSTAMFFLFHLPLSFALLLGAIGCATAPASTIMTIRQYHAKGEFVDTLLQVVALDDAVSLLAFSACTAIVNGMEQEGAFQASTVLLPLFWNVLVVGLGILFGFLLHKLIIAKRSSDHRLVLVNGVILSLTGICSLLHVSPLLACMALGTTYINISKNKALFKQVNHFTPPILLLFFVLSGMRLDLPALLTCGVIGVSYFFIRIIGKYIGACLGAILTKTNTQTKKFLGLALIPQAGVSIGLAALGQRMLSPELGTLLSTIILSSAVLYEMLGPASAKLALILSGSIPKDKTNDLEQDKSSSQPVLSEQHIG